MNKNKNIIDILIIGLVLYCFLINITIDDVSAYDDKGSWMSKTMMPLDRVGHGVVSTNGKIYVIGGYNKSGFLNSIESYDPINGTWEIKTPMPHGRAEFGVCAVGNLIFVIGGCHTLRGKYDYIYPANLLNSVLVYDTILDNWTYRSPMPTARVGLDLCSVENYIYAIGGARLLWNDCCYYFYDASGANEVYNIINDSWEILPDLITPRHHLGLVCIGDSIFACGGNKGADMWPPENIVERYSISSKTWESYATLPIKLTGFGISSMYNRIYIIGGLGYPGYHSDLVFEYDPIDKEWNNLSSMPDAKYGFDTCTFEDKIYVIGGAKEGVRSIYSKNNIYLRDIEEFTPPPSNISSKPYVSISYPKDNSDIYGSLHIYGTASVSQGKIQNVQIKIDSDSWLIVNGTNNWNFQFNVSSLNNGNHSISVRSFDGLFFSEIEKIDIFINDFQNNDKNIEIDNTPGFELIFTFCAIIMNLLFKKRKK